MIIQTTATGEEVKTIINQRLLPAIVDLERSPVLMALMTLTLTLMKPSITADELIEGVRGLSQWACLFLETDSLTDETLRVN